MKTIILSKSPRHYALLLTFLTACSSAPSPSITQDRATTATTDAGAETTDAEVAPQLDGDTGTVLDSATQGPDAAPITLEVADGGSASFDVVSAGRCAHRSGHFIQCVLPAVIVHDPNSASRGGSRKTTLTEQVTGDCSTQFPLQLGVQATDLPKTIFHLVDKTMDVRRKDGAAVVDLSINDESPFPGVPAYADTCHWWVTVSMNGNDSP